MIAAIPLRSYLVLLCTCVFLVGCGARHVAVIPPSADEPAEKLSSYGLFKGNGSTQEPVDGVVPYDLNSPLFSDYAFKYRFVRLPRDGTNTVPAKYDETEAFSFPVGTVLVKTFAFPHDARDLSKGQRLIETRLLIHKPDGWIGLPYVWNDQQSEATLKVAGGMSDVEWIEANGEKRAHTYLIPNVNQCKSCHENEKVMVPIGPKARNLNREYAYSDGKENQLTYWAKHGMLKDSPTANAAPRLPVWNDPTDGTVEQRARAWLEINCAHCHNPKGPARTSGLDLMATQQERYKFGIGRTTVAAGRGTGGHTYDIVPGKPDESILIYRMESTDPGVMMPEIGRRLVDKEAVALVREWIAGLQ